MRTLADLPFDNSYARLPAAFHQRIAPTPVPDAYLVAFNPDAARLIDLDPTEAMSADFVQYFAGNKKLPGSDPVAMKYAGHQFGTYVPQLGDGRAILLGEVKNAAGERWDLHLKGAGKTMFSRFGDGRAVLRSSIREYLACEAVHALGIPTTRALCIVGTDLEVYREGVESGALIVRLAPSHIRFGSFEVFAHRGQLDALRTLADYVIELHYPHLKDPDDKYVAFLREVVARTARLIAKWQAVGFAHGVLNTDNMSILGITLDYGPYGFMEEFDPGFICNHSDDTGRYAFDQQPRIGYWNLAALAGALTSLIAVDEARSAINTYADVFNAHVQELMAAKLGLATPAEGDQELWSGLLDLLAEARADYTIFFRVLGTFRTGPAEANDPIRRLFQDPARFDAWTGRYRDRLRSEGSLDVERKARMDRVNPKYVLRNYLAQIAIEKAERKDFSEVDRLRGVLRSPFDEQPEMEHYARPAPEWAKRLQVSCSS
ncbi:MAG TPA: YdiU family protein [Gemmataceae bacterium]|nr:YdiU family protein [Gemmataceae bacterium]